jgi:hypothetical protein
MSASTAKRIFGSFFTSLKTIKSRNNLSKITPWPPPGIQLHRTMVKSNKFHP